MTQKMAALLKLLLLSILSLTMIAVTIVEGDYRIGWVLRGYSASPSNFLATDGICCEGDCSPCSPVLRLCFRESGHPRVSTETCSLGTFLRNSPSVHVQIVAESPRIRGAFTGSFQVYVRVAHDSSVLRMFDQSDPLIDNVFFEFTGVTSTNELVILEESGVFNRSTIDLSVNVICALGYNGTDCNTFCEEINGTLTCREDEIIMPTTPPAATVTTSTDDNNVTDPEPTNPTSTQSSQTPSSLDGSTAISVGGLAIERSDNTLAIVVGVGVGGAVLLLVLVVGIIVIVLIAVRKRKNKQKTFYTVRRKETSSSANGDARHDDGDAQENGQPTNVEDLYATVNKQSKAPPLPPAYVPDTNEYQNLNSKQGHQGEIYTNTSASDRQDNHDHQESIYLRFADAAPTSHVNELDTISDEDESAT